MGKGSACDMDADQTDARARAEARRAKILARQKDRLSSITGVYGKQEGRLGQGECRHGLLCLLADQLQTVARDACAVCRRAWFIVLNSNVCNVQFVLVCRTSRGL